MVVAQVRRTIVDRELIPRGALVLCACSGGPDSAALLFALSRLARELGFRVEAASVDHGLRPSAAADVALAGRQAAQLGVAFHPLAVRVPRGASLQAQARAARYAALAGLAARCGASRIAVGHTRDDQAETVLSRLLRGSGLRGLAAIEPRRSDGVVRPLLDCRRADAHDAARAVFAELAEDSSNSDPRFERVRIRTHVMPLLLAEDPQLPEHLAALSDEAREYRLSLEQLAVELLERAAAGPGRLRLSVLAERPGLVRRAALRGWLDGHGIAPVSRAHLTALDDAVRKRRGHVWLPQGWSARVENDGLLQLQGSPPGGP